MPTDPKAYDVFLSHAHVDADFVKQLAAKLADNYDLGVWLDQWVLVPGELWQQDMAQGIGDAGSCAVCIGAKTPEGWFKQEVQRALNRQSREPKFRVIPIILPGGETSHVDNFLELRTWVDMRNGLDDEEALHRLVCGIRGLPPGRIVKKQKRAAPLFTVPMADNPFFTERGNELAELEKTLKKHGIAALTGMGGMGKTQTAARYAYLHREEYPAVIWVRAENQETLYADFSLLAKQLGLEEADAQEQKLVVEAVKRWLDEQPRWLLVLDNVVELKSVSDLTRKAAVKDRHIIVTTQSQSTGAIQRNELSTMESAEGALLLLRRANIIGPDSPLAEADADDTRVAKSISKELGGLPLALGQAGVYIQETDCGLAGYRELLNEKLPELLAERGDLDFEHESVAKTVIKSMQELATRNPAAADLVTATAFLAPEAIPEEIFTEGASEFGDQLKGAAADKLAWNQAIAVTLKFSLLDRDADKKTFSVHRTVQTVICWTMKREERRAWAEQVVRAMNAAFPDVQFQFWPTCERLLPHAQVCAGLIDELNISISPAARLLNQTGLYLKGRARFKEAEPLYRLAVDVGERVLGPDDTDVAAYFSNLAGLLYGTDRLAEAEPLMRRALAIWEKALGQEHPEVAIGLNNLAALLEDTNRLEEAEPLMRRALVISESSLGPAHPKVAIRLNNLANLLQSTNRVEEAEPLRRRAVAIGEETLGEDHPDLAVWLHNLATLLQDTNRFDEAETLMRRALEIFEKSLGADHPATASTRSNLEALLRARAAERES